jgi:hypothetical protein
MAADSLLGLGYKQSLGQLMKPKLPTKRCWHLVAQLMLLQPGSQVAEDIFWGLLIRFNP